MNKYYLLTLISIFVFNINSAAHADPTTFNVNLSGVDSNSFHTLSVTGTITVDPSSPVAASNIVSSLFFQHESDPLIPLLLSEGNTAADGLSWSVDAGNLFISRTSTVNTFLQWSGPQSVGFVLGAGSNSHGLTYRELSDDDEVTLLSSSGRDNGFLVGTAIPEPSSMMLLGICGAGLAIRRRSRR